MKLFLNTMTVLVLGLALTGCNTVSKSLPPNDEVLIYQRPYDLTYLRTMEALDNTAGWQLEETDKEKGLIVMRNLEYSNLSDSDLRTITFLVKRLGPGTTSISIDPKNQKVLGGDKLMKAVSSLMSREIAT